MRSATGVHTELHSANTAVPLLSTGAVYQAIAHPIITHSMFVNCIHNVANLANLTMPQLLESVFSQHEWHVHLQAG